MSTDRKMTTATSEAAKFVAAWQAKDSDGYTTVLHKAKKSGDALELAMALGIRCAQLAEELYGDRVQAELDGWALDALWFEEQEALKREVKRDDDA